LLRRHLSVVANAGAFSVATNSRQVFTARAARVAGLTLLETPARRRLGDESEATPASP
jgi:hypothetical protein